MVFRLSNKEYLSTLLQSGLDHIMFVLDPSDPDSWEALNDVVNADISLTVHITIFKNNNLPLIISAIEKLKTAGVTKVSLSAVDASALSSLPVITQKVHEIGLSLICDLPVPYSDMNPITMELQNSEKLLKGAGRSWLYLEPDGDVLPGQGINKVLGNMLTDSWESIWSATKIWLDETK
jgi:MoaA/NifB/PqqE/SkfB family radical SAM enzyme